MKLSQEQKDALRVAVRQHFVEHRNDNILRVAVSQVIGEVSHTDLHGILSQCYDGHCTREVGGVRGNAGAHTFDYDKMVELIEAK